MHGNILGRSDPDPNLIAFDAQNRHGDRVPDHQCFANPTRQDQHGASSRYFRAPVRGKFTRGSKAAIYAVEPDVKSVRLAAQ
jgi:hypothetical protein